MIVQCASCQTKFRVPDEKIGDKPVKVRCSKCQNVFSVKRGADGTATAAPLPGAKAPPPAAPPPALAAPAPAAPPPAAPAGSDPFAAFGPPPVARPGDATVPGVWHGGISATKRDEQNDVTRRAAIAEIEPTRPGFALNALIASKLDAPAPPPAIEAAPDPFAGPPMPASAMDPFAGPPRSSPTDPFANAPMPAPAAAATMDPFGDPGPAPESTLQPPAAAPELPAAAPLDPFANLDLSAAAPPPLPTPAPEAAPASALVADPFANLDLGAVAGNPAPEPAGAPTPAAARVQAEPAGVSFSFEPGGSAAPASPSAEDFFGNSELAGMPQSSVGSAAFGDETTQTQPAGEPDRSLFDIPAKAPAPLPAPETPFDSVPTRVAPIPKPVPRPATTSTKPAAPKKPLGQRAIGIVLSALFVAVVGWGSLITYATARADWHFDAALLRPSELGRAVFGNQGAAAQLALEEVSSGTYELEDGHTAFYVRGELVNRGKSKLGPARARVDVLESDHVLASAEAWAGQPVTPEQVYDLSDAKQLAVLEQQEQSAARPLEPGQSRPFVAVMLDVPLDGAIRSVRIVPDLGGK